MLPEKIMHEITMSLIRDIEKENPAEEDIESLCKLITTIGTLPLIRYLPVGIKFF